MSSEDLVPSETMQRIKAGELATIRTIVDETGIPEQTIREWVRQGYVERVHISPRRILVNRGQVLSCAEVYHPKPAARR